MTSLQREIIDHLPAIDAGVTNKCQVARKLGCHRSYIDLVIDNMECPLPSREDKTECECPKCHELHFVMRRFMDRKVRPRVACPRHRHLFDSDYSDGHGIEERYL